MRGRRLIAALLAVVMTAMLGFFTYAAYGVQPDHDVAQPSQSRTAVAADGTDTGDGEGDDDALSASSADGKAKLYLSANRIGNVADAPSGITLTLAVVGEAGTSYTVTIPKSSSYAGTYTIGPGDDLPADIGTVTRTETADAVVFSIDFKTASASVELSVNLTAINNYTSQSVPMTIIGESTRTIKWTCRKKTMTQAEQMPPLTIRQYVKPAMSPKAPVRTSPDQGSVPAVNGRTDYTYRFDVNEADGVHDDTSYASAQVNSTVNYGTTITIPTPPHFILNTDATAAKNAFDDATTISQPGGEGHDIIITVPKGSGAQGYQGKPGYYLVGRINAANTTATQTFTASGDITIDQTYVDAQGVTRHLRKTLPDDWSEQLRSSDQKGLCPVANGQCLKVTIAGNNTDNDILLTDPSHLTTLVFGGFANNSPEDLEDAVITMDVPSGFDATAIVTPVSATDLKGLTSYRYELTLADGTQESGTVAAGGTITRVKDSPIRTAKLYPNLLAAGAHTADASSCTPLADDNANCAGRVMLYLQGTLAAKYDDGAPVKRGDNLITSISLTDPEKAFQWDADSRRFVQFSVKASVTQQVIVPSQLRAALQPFGWQNGKEPGNLESGYLSVYQGYGGTTPTIYEPEFYYVLPTGTVYNRQKGLTSLNSNNGKSPSPKVSEFQASDGREVVKISYRGTGYWFNCNEGANTQAWLSILGNATTGVYPYSIYVYSPTTPMTNRKVDTSAASWNPTWVEGRTADLYEVGGGSWSVNAARILMSTTQVQGNLDVMFSRNGESNDIAATNTFRDAREMNIEVVINNGSSIVQRNLQQFVNLPDGGGDGFGIRLTGPVTTATDRSVVPDGTTVTYSTAPATLSARAVPDTTSYVDAAHVTDWTAIRSVLITVPQLSSNTVAGHFILHGIDPTLAVDAGKSESVESGLYISGLQLTPLIYRAGDERAPTITVSGKSTITAQLAYVDASGTERVVPLENLTRHYRNNQDVFTKSDFPQTLSELKAKEGDLVPAGYNLESIRIVGDTTARYPGGYPAGTAQWDTTARYDYNGSVVRYELLSTAAPHMPITGADGFWNVFTLSALLAGMTLIPGWCVFSGLRRRHGR